MISKEKIKQRFISILSLDAHPAHISGGFAVGVFISFIPPIPGLHTALAIISAFLFRLNKISCLTGTWVNSYITTIPSMILSYKLGAFIIGIDGSLKIDKLDWESLKTVLVSDAVPLMLGCSILGFIAAIISYFVCYRLIIKFRSRDPLLEELTQEMEATGEELE